jgi:demethylmenaquinone methyltransferase/2-methoxy-6-polyprenyl-1,4-benzoquinol methylase
MTPKPDTDSSYVHRMFSRISPFYDRMNRFISLGQDDRWRRAAVAAAALPDDGHLLDVGVGTGELSLTAQKGKNGLRVTGLDFNERMLQVGRKRVNGQAIGWTTGDGMRLPYPDDTFDAVMSGFFVRNLFTVHGEQGVIAAFAEQRRVVRPGGRVVCLEFNRPQFLPFRLGSYLYVNVLIPLVAGALSGEWDTYRYLGQSISRFLSVQGVKEAMLAVGLHQVSYRRLTLGNVALHVGLK